MSTDPYAAPSADLGANEETIPTSIWSAKGRLSILSYFAQNLVLLLVFGVIAVAIMMIIGLVFGGGDIETMLSTGGAGGGAAGIAMAVTMIPLYIALIWTSVCLIIKRLHDRNHTGWWSLIFIIPLINLLLFIYICLFRGNKHSNRFGAQRPTKGWEKVVGVIGFILTIGSIIAMIGVFGAAMFGMGGGGFESMMQGG